MKYSLVKIHSLSGEYCSIYSIRFEKEDETLLDKFILENNSFKSETKELIKRLKSIGHKTGARKDYFKENEGIPGDGVCALYDENSNLRLYCIKYGTQLIVIGSGGYKPKNIRAFQEDEKLTKENYLLREISRQISQRMHDDGIRFSANYLDFIGDLEFEED